MGYAPMSKFKPQKPVFIPKRPYIRQLTVGNRSRKKVTLGYKGNPIYLHTGECGHTRFAGIFQKMLSRSFLLVLFVL